jgi:pimeloyl-ACP methyl ester carboxylesterase
MTPTAIDTFDADLPHGIRLNCRASGPKGAPVLMFLHGFPEAAFVWDEMLTRFGDRFRCIAPNLRGFAPSSAPADVAAYKPKLLAGDLMALIAQESSGPLEALIAHDWGGAVAWGLAATQPQALKRLVIINSPHPAVFLKALQTNPEQQAASAYMNFLRRPDAEAKLSADGFKRMWGFFDTWGDLPPDEAHSGWLTDAVKSQYLDTWTKGLTGPLNYYRASPLHPPTDDDRSVMDLVLPPEVVTVKVPTHVVWAEADRALPKGLLDGLEAYVPKLTVTRVPNATHWIVHEQPALVAREIESALAR